MSVRKEALKRVFEKPFTIKYPLETKDIPDGVRLKPRIVDYEKPDLARIGCPAHLDIRGYVRMIVDGRYQEGIDLIREKLCLPACLGRVCNHPCEDLCKRNYGEEDAVANRDLKRFLADWEYEKKQKTGEPLIKKPENPKNTDLENRVAVVGSGPAGLQAACDLTMLGYPVTVFEAREDIGGMLRYGIPNYKLPPDVLDREIKAIKDIGVEFRTGIKIGKDKTLAELKDEGYKAIFMAVGSHISHRLGIEGEDMKGVEGAIDFLCRLNAGENIEIGKKVVIIGGGNVAIDVARCTRRLGGDVKLICLEARDEMPAHDWEIAEAEEEGVEIINSRAPREFISKDGQIRGVKTVEVESVFNEKGNFNPTFSESVQEKFAADNIFIAIGQAADLSVLSGYEDKFQLVGRGRLVAVDPETCETSMEGIFAEGELVRGPATIIEAISGGRKASLAIDKYLSGNNDHNPFVDPVEYPTDVSVVDITEERKYMNLIKEEEYITRREMPKLKPEERIDSFAEVYLGYSEEEAKMEAERCLSCYKCVGCEVCQINCPNDAIKLAIIEEDKDKNWKKSSWKADGPPEISLLKCCSCQLCEELCRCGMFQFTKEFETALTELKEANLVIKSNMTRNRGI